MKKRRKRKKRAVLRDFLLIAIKPTTDRRPMVRRN